MVGVSVQNETCMVLLAATTATAAEKQSFMQMLNNMDMLTLFDIYCFIILKQCI